MSAFPETHFAGHTIVIFPIAKLFQSAKKHEYISLICLC